MTTPLTHLLVSFCDITTVLLCVICKVPQILLIYRSKSVQGISEGSVALELLTYLISLCYNSMRNYPLSSYMEDPFLSVQTLVVLLLVYNYDEGGNKLRDGKRVGALVGMFGIMYVLSTGWPDERVLQGLLTATLPMKVFSKVLQLAQIWRTYDASTISLLSWGINIYTCVTRIITTLLVTNDTTILIKHTLSVTLNSAVVVSAWWVNKRSGSYKKER